MSNGQNGNVNTGNCHMENTNGQWFSPGPPVSSTNKTNLHDIAEILLKVALNTIKQTNKQSNKQTCVIGIFNLFNYHQYIFPLFA
jgi:hypothetical protein